MGTPSIVDVYPANDAQGVVLGDQIRVLFDREMDETSINTGTFVVLGTENNYIFGPDFNPLDEPGIEDEGILNSPYVTGYVDGVIEFKRISLSGEDEVETLDTTGDGLLYRTQATFVPSKPFAAGVRYTVFLAGDESDDDYKTGCTTRTVFDTVTDAEGSGSLEFIGGYTGTAAGGYGVEITTGGVVGTAEYVWWRKSDPLTVYPGVTTTGRRELEDGVWVVCDPDGTFQVGDRFTVECKVAETLENNYRWTFTTGSGSIVIPPSVSSTSVLKMPRILV